MSPLAMRRARLIPLAGSLSGPRYDERRNRALDGLVTRCAHDGDG